MPIPITSCYLILFALMSIGLVVSTAVMRTKTGISIGDGGSQEMLLASRRHGNFVENIPLLMLMFAALELNGASAAWMHGLGVALVIARVAHAVGLRTADMPSLPRAGGVLGTLLVTLVAAGKLLSQMS